MYKTYASKGLGLLSMNRGDTPMVVKDYWRKEGFTFPAIMAPVKWHDRYGVSAYPTNYVVDKTGKVRAVFVGFDETGLKAAVRKLGVPVK